MPAPTAWFSAAGLACDDDGVALGPVRLVAAVINPSGRRFYRLRPAPEVAQATG